MAIGLVSGPALRDQLADRLRLDLLSCRFKSGEKIRQEELGALYGVSRTPVREAMMQLRNEGLLESLPNGGVRVTPPPNESMRGFFDALRHAVEEHALRICLDTLNDNDFEVLGDVVAKMKAACKRRDDMAIAELDLAFHRHLVQRSGQPTLVAIWSLVLSGLRAYFQTAYAAFDDRMAIYREHVEIVKRFRSQDKEAAIRFYVSHIGTTPKQRRMHKSRK
jgi:DNA-binding GntR family transcriptional regulator